MFSAAKSRHSILPSLAVLFAAAFGLNFPWEMLQMPAYVEMAGRGWREAALTCFAASLGDAAITLGIYGLAALFSSRQELKVKWHHYALASLLGAASAVAIERAALSAGRWSYTGLMPVVPVLGVGLWPLLQLALLVPAALWITFFIRKKWGLS